MNKQLLTALGTVAITTSSLFAGDFATPIAPETPVESKLSGSLSLDLNSHFISYGFDVWGGGDSLTSKPTFNPSVGLDYALTESLTLSTGFWLDVNGHHGVNTKVQETDIWIGAAYTQGIATYSATYQTWQYASDSEIILDLGVSFDTFLSPSLTVHHRLNEGASGGFDGTFLVLGAEHSFDLSDKFSITIPLSVGFAIDDFHTTEDGYGFASIGLQGSYALCDSTSLNAGVTFYDTDSGVIGNPEDQFITANVGLSFSF
ncbi:MAG: hypothetical protein ACSHX6_14775 [Akkermansiaceae bacterium]